ncbi:MAG: carboxylesterase/lipase family protein, partial [Actinomycetota bacterium]
MRGLPRASIIVVLLAVASATAVPAASGDDLVVVTNAGPVRGVATATMQEWRGIPYAAPPVGDLRWRPPATVTPWTDVRAATRFRKPCVQLGETRHDTIGREDCLYLNVFAPMDAIATSSLPVMVHLHPGSNYFGGAYRDPSAFIERGVVVVTLNYRLGILGFNGPKALNEEPGNHSGEYGMLDQIAALEWVQANIAAFGGNPDNVTLFGSSAGTFDTVALMVSPLARGLLDRVAVQGEFVYALTGTFNRINFAYVGGRHAARVSGCNAADDVVACLRSLPARELVKIEGPGDVAPLVGGVVLPEPVIELLDDGPEIPLLVGFDREEDRYFALPYPLPELSRPDWIERTTDLVGPEHAEEVRALYPPSEYDSRAWAFVTMQTDVARGCPTRRLANASDGPVWRWLYTNVYDQLDDGDGRAAHVFEEPLLWQIPSAEWFGVDFALTPGEELLSDRMTDYWTNFAKTG